MKQIQVKWFYLLGLALIWGSSFILIKKGLLGLTAIQLGALRTVLTGVILLAVGFGKLKLIQKHEWKWIALSGIVGSFIPAFLFAIAETEIDSSVASILNSLVPLNTILLGFAVFKIASTKRQVLGVVLGFVGTAILILKGAELNPEQNYLYAGFVILSTVMYAINVNVIKRYLQHVKPLSIAAGNYLIITPPAVIILILSGFFSAQTMGGENFEMAFLYIGILSLFGTAMAKVMFNKLVQISTPVFASSVTYLMPVVALIWGVIDGESFSWIQGLGTAIILLGVYMSHKRKK